MKRFSKILAFVLVAIMLVGMLAMNSFAATDKLNQLNLTDEEKGITAAAYSSSRPGYSDFEDASLGCLVYSEITKGSAVARKGAGNNTYVSVYQDGRFTPTENSHYFDTLFNRANKQSKTSFWESDYATYDFDLATDIYVLTLKHIFGDAYADLEKNADGYAAYKADNTAGVEAGTLYTDVNGNNVKYEQQTVWGVDVVADADGYAVYVANNKAGVAEGTFVTDAQGNPIKLDDLKLGYVHNYKASIMFASNSSTSSSYVTTQILVTYNESENQWYLDVSDEKVPLSREVNHWNHITMLFDFGNEVTYYYKNGAQAYTGEYDKTLIDEIDAGTHGTYGKYTLNISSTRIRVYLDGEYVASLAPYSTTFDTSKPHIGYVMAEPDIYDIRHQITGSAKTLYANNKFSMCFDNYASHYYKHGYDGELAEFAKSNYTQPIYNLSDVVYNGNYVNVNASLGHAYANAGDETPAKSFDLAVGALDYVALNGGYATISSDVLNYDAPVGAKLQSIFIKLENGAKLTLKSNSFYYIKETSSLEGYVELAPAAKVSFYLTDVAVAAGTPDEVFYLKPGDAIASSKDVSDGSYYMGEGLTVTPTAWNYYTDLAAEGVAFEYGSAMTDELYNATIANGGEISVHPEYTTTQALFVVTDDGVETLYTSATEFVGALKGKGGRLQVVLYGDVLIDAEDIADRLIKLAGSAVLNLDVNGHTLGLYNCNTKNTTRLFQPVSKNVYNLYSSKEGGLISSYLGRIFDGTSTNDSSNNVITVGKYMDIPGSNLTVSCNYFYFGSGANNADSYMNIDGATINSGRLIMNVRNHWHLKINDAKIHVHTTATSAGTYFIQSTSNGGYDVDINKSTILITGTKTGTQTGSRNFICTAAGNTVNMNIADSTIAVTGAKFIAAGADSIINITVDKDTILESFDDPAPYITAAEGTTLAPAVLGFNTTLSSNTIADNGNASKVSASCNNAKYEYVVVPNTAIDEALTGVQANIATNNGFWVNFYVPVGLDIKVLGDYTECVNIGGVEYAIYAVKGIAPNSVEDAKIAAEIKYKGYTCTVQPSVSLYDYFKAVIDGEYSELSKDLVMNAVNYCNAVYKATNSDADYAPYAELLTVEENAARIDTVVVEDAVYNIVDNTVITSATLMITDGNTAKFAFGNGGSGANLVATITRIDGTTKQLFAEERGEYYVIDEMSAYDMAATLIIETTDGKLVAEYNLAAYLANTQDATVTAFYGYVKAAIAYQSAQLEQN